MNFSSSADRWMVKFSFLETIGLERSQKRLDCQSVGCGEVVETSGCTLGNLVVPIEWRFTLGTIVGYFDWTFTLGTSVGVGDLVVG